MFSPLRRTIFTSRLDGRFIGLRAGIAEEDLFQSRFLRQKIRCLDLRFGVKQVGYVLQLFQLRRYRFHPSVVAEAQTVYADSCGEVDVFLAVHGNAFRALAVVSYHIITGIRSHDFFLI